MRLFLDSSVLLAASGSTTGASRLIIGEGASRDWILVSSLYCFEETRNNLPKLGIKAEADFGQVIPCLMVLGGGQRARNPFRCMLLRA